MPFAETIACEITFAHPRHLEHLARLIWQGHASGALSDSEAQDLAELLRDRQHVPHHGPSPISPPAAICESARAHLPRPPRSPDRQRSLERRRRLSAAGLMPPAIAMRFTLGERAVLYVVATEAQRRGRCDLYIDQLAAFAGVSRSTARNAVRQAKRLGLIQVTEWKQAPDWNGPNRITIIDQAWLAWLAHGSTSGKTPTPSAQKMRVKNLTTTRNQIFPSRSVQRGERPKKPPIRELGATPRAHTGVSRSGGLSD